MKRYLKATAPGKLVLSGDYAVLLGAPAIVLSVDRYAVCTYEAMDRLGWLLESLPSNEEHHFRDLDELMEAQYSSVQSLFASFAKLGILAPNAHFCVDTSSFYHQNTKLGIGSSAASLVATAKVIETLSERSFSFDDLYRMHGELQGSNGSGLDIAASIHGGVIVYQNKHAESIELHPEIYFSYVYSGYGTTTGQMLDRFNLWRKKADCGLIHNWLEAARSVVDYTDDPDEFVRAISHQTDLLERMDNDAKLGIFSSEHQTARSLAKNEGLVYKPSGAGGGDMGIAIGTDPEAIQRFERNLANTSLILEHMSISESGVGLSN